MHIAPVLSWMHISPTSQQTPLQQKPEQHCTSFLHALPPGLHRSGPPSAAARPGTEASTTPATPPTNLRSASRLDCPLARAFASSSNCCPIPLSLSVTPSRKRSGAQNPRTKHARVGPSDVRG